MSIRNSYFSLDHFIGCNTNPNVRLSHHGFDMILDRNHQGFNKLNEKLKIVARFARHFPAHTKHHYITSSCPFGFITIDLNESMVNSPPRYPPVINDIKFTREDTIDPNANISVLGSMEYHAKSFCRDPTFQQMSMKQWKQKFVPIMSIINSVISTDHGVTMSFSNGTEITVHVGDALLLIFSRERQLDMPKVNLESTIFNDTLLTFSFTDNLWYRLTEDQQQFLMGNVDGFWIILSYWSNLSIIPNRIDVPVMAEFEHSNLLNGKEIFRDFMSAKMDDFRRSLRLCLSGARERFAKYGVKYADDNLDLEWWK